RCSLFLILMTSPSPTSTLFPYTTLFRSAMLSKLSFAQETRRASRWKSRSNGAATEKKVFEESREAFLEAVKLVSGHTEDTIAVRSEEHTSELQSPYDLVCRLLLEKKKKT